MKTGTDVFTESGGRRIRFTKDKKMVMEKKFLFWWFREGTIDTTRLETMPSYNALASLGSNKKL